MSAPVLFPIVPLPPLKRKLDGLSHYDYFATLQSGQSQLTFTSLTGFDAIPQGSGASTREGANVFFDRLELRGYWALAPPPSTIVDGDAGIGRLIVALAVDPGSNPITDVLETVGGPSPTLFSPYSASFVEPFGRRVRILHDGFYPLTRYNSIAPVWLSIPLNVMAQYNRTGGTTCIKNRVYILHVWNGGGALANYPFLSLGTVLYYKE